MGMGEAGRREEEGRVRSKRHSSTTEDAEEEEYKEWAGAVPRKPRLGMPRGRSNRREGENGECENAW